MQQRSGTLQDRLNDIERRLRTFRTVTNTASAEITGGETVIDEDGSIIFSDGGTLRLGGSSIQTYEGSSIIDSEGNLHADSLEVHGDVLSASDYLYQRETIDSEVINTTDISSIDREVDLGFPDWSSTALAVFDVYVNSRFRGTYSNPMTVYLNGKPIARPKTDELGNIVLDSSVVRRITPEHPAIRITVDVSGEVVPVDSPAIRVKIGGVFSV